MNPQEIQEVVTPYDGQRRYTLSALGSAILPSYCASARPADRSIVGPIIKASNKSTAKSATLL